MTPSPISRRPMNPGRRRLAHRLMLWSVPLAAIILLVSGRVVVLDLTNDSGRAAYGRGDHSDAQVRFQENEELNPFQRWVAPFNDGGAKFRAGDHSGAVASFERALELAPKEHECTVRVNLAIAREGIGDRVAARDQGAARRYWEQARKDLADCRSQQAQQTQQRLEQKLQQGQPSSSSSSSSGPSSSSGSSSSPGSGSSSSSSGSGSSSSSGSGSSSSSGSGEPTPDPDASRRSELRSLNLQGQSKRDSATATDGGGGGGDGQFRW